MGWESKRLVETVANKARECRSCETPWEVGERIFLLKDIVKDTFEMLCLPCGNLMNAEKKKAQAEPLDKPQSVGIKLPFQNQEPTQDRDARINDIITCLEGVLQEIKSLRG